MDAKAWEYELSLFTEDLIASLLCRHPELHKLASTGSGSLHFTDEVGKCVLLTWRDKKNELDEYLVRDYPSFVESEDCFKQYLKRFVEMQKENVTSRILGLSALLVGILFFLHRKGMTHFVQDASSYLFFMLSSVTVEEFHEEGGWPHLASVAAKLSEDYDEETFRQYISAHVCSLNDSDATGNTNIDSTLQCSIETLPEKTFKADVSVFPHSKERCENYEKEMSVGVSEKHSPEVVSVLNKPEDVSVENKPEDESKKDSTAKEISSDEIKEKHSPEVVSVLNKPEDVSVENKSEDESKKDSTAEEISSDEIKEKHSPEVVLVLNKPEDETKEDSVCKVDPNEVIDTISQKVVSILNKSKNKTEKDSTNKADLNEVTNAISRDVALVLNETDKIEKDFANKVDPNEVTISQVLSGLNKSEDKPKKVMTNEAILDDLKEHSQLVPILNKTENELKESSTNKEITKEVTDKYFQEVVSVPKKSEDESEKDLTNEEFTPNEVKEKNSQKVVSISSQLKDEIKKDSANNQDDSNEVTDTISQKVVSVMNKSEDKLEKDPINEEFTPNEVKEHSYVTNLNILDDEPEINSPNIKAILNEVKDLIHDDVMVYYESEEKPRNNFTKLNSSLTEATTEIKNVSLKHLEVLQEETTTKLSSDLKSPKSKELTLEYVKTNECVKVSTQSLLQNSVHQDVLESPLVPEKKYELPDSSLHLSLNLVTSPQKFESLKEENFPREESKTPRDTNISTGECATHSTVDFRKLRGCQSEPFETNPTNCELAKEVDKFLTDEILSHFQVRFLTKDEEELIDEIKFCPVDNVRKDCNVHTLKQDGKVEIDLARSNNIPPLENLAKIAVLSTEKKSAAEHVCTNDKATKYDLSLFKSPKHEINKKAVPNKAKTPTSGKCGVKDTKNKTAVSGINDSVIPPKTPTRTPKSSSFVSSPGMNMTDTKTAKKLNNSPALKSSSPRLKIPTDKGVPSIHSKSSEKTEKNRNFLLPKASTEITKSSTKSVSAANRKSGKEELSDSSKPLPSTVRTKLGEKDLSNNFKSSNNTSEPIPKRKVNTIDIPITWETRKPANPKAENVSREKTAGSSSAKTTDQSESTTSKSFEEYLDNKACKEESASHIAKCDQNKVNEPSTSRAKVTTLNSACRTRNVHGKNISTDSKNEKPRWR